MPDDSTENYDGPVTVIGLFSVTAAEQDELVKVNGETAQIMRAQRGFLGSEVFATVDEDGVHIGRRGEVPHCTRDRAHRPGRHGVQVSAAWSAGTVSQ